MNLKATSSRHSPAPGVQQQQQAEAMSKQRAQAQQAAQMQAQNASAMAAMQMNQYQQSPQMQQPPMYNNMYTPSPQGAPPPPYPNQQTYGQPMGMLQAPPQQMQPPQQVHASHYAQQQQNLHAQATARAGRQRASTMDQPYSGIPPAMQRVVSHLDPNAPIRLQPSPAYIPPPADGTPDGTPGGSRRRTSRASNAYGRGNRDFIRTLEDRSVDDYMMGTQPWH